MSTTIASLYGATTPLLSKATLITTLTTTLITLLLTLLLLALSLPPYRPTTTIKWIVFLRASLTLLIPPLLLTTIRTALLLKSYTQTVSIPTSFRLEEVFTEDVFQPLVVLIVTGCVIHLVNEQRRGINAYLGKGRSLVGGIQGWIIKVLFLATCALWIAHFSLSFSIARDSISDIESSSDGSWRLGDRDFGLLLDKSMVQRLVSGGESLDWVKARLFMGRGEEGVMPAWVAKRSAMIQVGLARDWCIVAIAIYETLLASYVYFKKARSITSKGASDQIHALLLLLTTLLPGLLWTTLFSATVTTHYTTPNWTILTSIFPWLTYFTSSLPSPPFNAASTTWLTGYRLTSPNFFLVRALLQPVGLMVALAGAVCLARRAMRRAREEEKLGGMGALEGMEMGMGMPGGFEGRGVPGEGRGMQSIDLRD